MFERHDKAVYELLRDLRLVELAQLDALNEEHQATGQSLADAVVERGFLEKSALFEHIARHLGCIYLPELPAKFPVDAITTLTGKLARDYGVMPLRVAAHAIDLLVADPFNHQIVDDLAFAL